MMMDNDFPATLGGGSSTGFLKGYTSRMFGGSVNNTQLPTTGEYATIQQTMRDGQYSPMAIDYGKFRSAPYDVARGYNPLSDDSLIYGQSPNPGLQPILPKEKRGAVDSMFGRRIRGDAIDIGPGASRLQLPPI